MHTKMRLLDSLQTNKIISLFFALKANQHNLKIGSNELFRMLNDIKAFDWFGNSLMYYSL